MTSMVQHQQICTKRRSPTTAEPLLTFTPRESTWVRLIAPTWTLVSQVQRASSLAPPRATTRTKSKIEESASKHMKWREALLIMTIITHPARIGISIREMLLRNHQLKDLPQRDSISRWKIAWIWIWIPRTSWLQRPASLGRWQVTRIRLCRLLPTTTTNTSQLTNLKKRIWEFPNNSPASEPKKAILRCRPKQVLELATTKPSSQLVWAVLSSTHTEPTNSCFDVKQILIQ